VLTQAELISHALDNEEGNLVEHRDYLKLEEEKRKRARVVRSVVEGPLLRWISKTEEIKVQVPAPQPQVSVAAYGGYNFGFGGASSYPPTFNFPLPAIGTSTAPSIQPQDTVADQTPTAVTQTYNFSASQTQNPNPSSLTVPAPTSSNPYMSYLRLAIPPAIPPPPPPPIEITQTVEKNYVVHERAQYEGVSKPPWNDTMTAMFGNHVKWDALRVYVGKGRPLGMVSSFLLTHRQLTSLLVLARSKTQCPITGSVAKYVDPRTGVPFASVEAYNTLTKVLEHQFVWSKELCCYTRDGDWEGFKIEATPPKEKEKERREGTRRSTRLEG
jgi:hypothetical protein